MPTSTDKLVSYSKSCNRQAVIHKSIVRKLTSFSQATYYSAPRTVANETCTYTPPGECTVRLLGGAGPAKTVKLCYQEYFFNIFSIRNQ